MAESEASKRWRQKNKAYLAKKSADYRKKYPERIKSTVKYSTQKYRDSKRDTLRVACRKWHLKAQYGLTVEQYDAMLLEQQGVCAVCRRPETGLRRGKVKSLDVDHNHATGQVRKLLCSGCNAALGLLKEDPLRIRALAEYIEHYHAE